VLRFTALRILAACAAFTTCVPAFAWGPDGHSIVAELASRRLSPQARQEVERLLGPGVSLASIANWADDWRPAHPETFNWHFVDIPVAIDRYDPAAVCAPGPKGDCIIAALARERAALACPGDAVERRLALRFAVHFLGDLHQPLHTVNEEQGGNGVKVTVDMVRAGRCPKCTSTPMQTNLHSVWDTLLITNTTYNWGAYVTRLEEGWLASAQTQGLDAGTVEDWALESHKVGSEIWTWTPEDHVINDDYYRKALPVVDRQLSLGGLRLARFLNDVFTGKPAADCPAR
jgi:hypothetical protein